MQRLLRRAVACVPSACRASLVACGRTRRSAVVEELHQARHGHIYQRRWAGRGRGRHRQQLLRIAARHAGERKQRK